MATVVRLTPPQKVTCGGYTLDSFVIELSDAALDFRFQLGDGYDIFWALPAAAADRLRLFHMDNAAYEVDEPELRSLDFLQRYTLAIDFSTLAGAQAQLEATNAFRDAQQADAEGIRLLMP